MSIRVRIMAALVLSVVGASIAAPGTALGHTSGSCSQNSSHWHWTSFSNGNLIRQHDIHENYSGNNQTVTMTASSTSSSTDSVNIDASISGSVKAAIFAELEGQAGIDLGYVGQATTFGSVSKTSTLASGDTYIFYGGVRRHLGYFKYYGCDWQYHIQYIGSGTAYGYLSRVTGLVGCKQYAPSGTMAASAKALYC